MADEMLGRLARYMRFAGLDVAYMPGLSDEEVLARAEREGRVLVTRDVGLSARSSRVVLLNSPTIEEQWRGLRARFPGWPADVAFARCTVCNGRLDPETRLTAGESEPALRPVYVCIDCGHRYWEGSHTAAMRARLARWAVEPRP
jgi:uncharacterized protein with PIN domain